MNKFKVGDKIKLLKTSCKCHICREAKEDFWEVCDVSPGLVSLVIGDDILGFPLCSTIWEVESLQLENE